jgi:hypothetical protein
MKLSQVKLVELKAATPLTSKSPYTLFAAEKPDVEEVENKLPD